MPVLVHVRGYTLGGHFYFPRVGNRPFWGSGWPDPSKRWGLRPPPFGRVSGAPRAAQTTKMTDPCWCWFMYSMLRNSASGPDIGLPGRIYGPEALLCNIEYVRASRAVAASQQCLRGIPKCFLAKCFFGGLGHQGKPLHSIGTRGLMALPPTAARPNN